MKTKHTQGEWKLNQNGDQQEYIIFAYTTYTASAIASVYSNIQHHSDVSCPEISEDEAKANAKLIVAAPEMLENLIRCVDRLEENGMGDMSAVKRAKTAIKKATA